MRKRNLALTLLFAAVALPASSHAAPRGEAKTTVAGKAVSVDYGRPSLQGRDMLGRAEIGTPWRLGADAATTLTTDADLLFGSAAVPKGSYVLTATKTAEGKWTLNVVRRDEAKTKVADVPLASTAIEPPVETLTLELSADKDKGTFEIKWGNVALSTPFSGK
jgi:hypothetical protein